VVLTDEQLKHAEAHVLSIVSESPSSYRPRDVIDRLNAQGISEYLVRAAIWYLIDRNAIELTWDRRLRRAGLGRGDVAVEHAGSR